MKKTQLFLFCILMIINTFIKTCVAQGSSVVVSSLASLQDEINKAIPGETIILADGVYTSDTKILIDRKGSAANPITIAAKTIGGVEVNGSEGFELGSSAAYATIQGFKFTHVSGKTKIAVGANHCRITRNVFECSGKGAYLTVSGDDNQVDHNSQTRGENENICNKSCDNIYRYNTFGEGVSELSLRHGNRCQVYGKKCRIGSNIYLFFKQYHPGRWTGREN